MKGSRRGFVTGTIGGGLAGLAAAHAAEDKPKAVQVDRRTLGRTGAEVSIIGIGLAAAFTTPNGDDPERGEAVLERTLDLGINYWDTARAYGKSEILVGPVVERRRKEIFLVSKSGARDYDGFMRDFETSLKNLRTDHLDLCHIHDLNPDKGDKIPPIGKGAFKAILKLKEQGVIKNYGVTGHSGAAILIEAVKAFDPDVLLTIFPANRPDEGRYEDELLPLAIERNMGVAAMKTVLYARNSNQPPTELIRYALSLPGMSTAVVGIGELDHLESNAKLATGFTPFKAPERLEFNQKVVVNLPSALPQPWDIPGYQDMLA